MRIGVLVGSIAKESINKKLASTFPNLAPEGVEFVDIDISGLPMYSYDLDGNFPAVALEFKALIDSVDGVIIVTPEYSRSIPGVLKNALDWSARPYGQFSFYGKPVAIIGASQGNIGTAAAQQHLRAILGHYNAYTMGQPEAFFVYRPNEFGPNGEVLNDATAALLEGYLAAVTAHVERFAPVTV